MRKSLSRRLSDKAFLAGYRPKLEETTTDRSIFEHLRSQFLLADHGVSQERFFLKDCSFRSRQFFAQCLKLSLKRRHVTERLTQSLVVRHLKERSVAVRLFNTLLERFRMIDKLNRCAHFFTFS